MTALAWAEGLRALLPGHDGVLLDLWGTLHDGARLYDGARGVLDGLADAGVPVLLFSNAPRTALLEADRLAAMGVADHPLRRVLTAGEIWRDARRRAPAGEAVLHCGPAGNLGLFEALDLTLIEDPARADVLVVSDLDPACGALEGHDGLLGRALARGLAMHCINPDSDAVSPAGLVPRAGAVAARYRAMGGRVVLFGKPEPRAYAAARAVLGGIAPDRLLAVGDKIGTDITGAHAAGMTCVLVASGREHDRMGLRGDDSDLARLAPLLPAGCRVLPDLRW